MTTAINKRKILTVVGAFALTGAILAGAYFWLGNGTSSGLEFEDNATVGIMPGVDLDERLKELQDQLDRSKIAFSVNTSPVFQGRVGNLMLENPANNGKLLVAQLVLEDGDRVIYSSKALRPGSYLEQIRLETTLPAGSYQATVYLKAYDESTQELLGQTGAQILLTVEA